MSLLIQEFQTQTSWFYTNKLMLYEKDFTKHAEMQKWMIEQWAAAAIDQVKQNDE